MKQAKKKFQISPKTFSLYLITDSRMIADKGVTEVIACCVKCGVTAIQLREKYMSTREFVELARTVRSYLTDKNVPLIINDRIDITQAIGADGVHLGQSDLHYADAYQILGDDYIIGLTVENMPQARMSKKYEADYIGLSSIFKTSTKEDAIDYWNADRVRYLKSITDHKLIGIGGLNKSNAEMALRWGLDGIAVISAICNMPNLQQVRRETMLLKKIVESHYEN